MERKQDIQSKDVLSLGTEPKLFEKKEWSWFQSS